MSLAAVTIISGAVGVFAVMIILQIMINVGSAIAMAVEKKAAAAAAKKAELAAREARRAKRAAAMK